MSCRSRSSGCGQMRRRRRQRLSSSWWTTTSHLLVLLLFVAFQCSNVKYRSCVMVLVEAAEHDAYYDEYVQEVLEEDQRHYGDSNEDSYHYDDEYVERLKQQQQDAERRKQQEEERLAQEKLEKIAAERERQFQRDLAKMNDEQRKLAIKQKKRDTNIVKSILKANKHNDYYSVLGIRNWKLKIPGRKFNIGKYSFGFSGITLKHTSTKDIRRAYKQRAKVVHPDKNRDGLASEAFTIVEHAASILTNEQTRNEYDKSYTLMIQQKRQKYINVLNGIGDTIKLRIKNVIWVFHKVLGPFAPAVLIISAILI